MPMHGASRCWCPAPQQRVLLVLCEANMKRAGNSKTGVGREVVHAVRVACEQPSRLLFRQYRRPVTPCDALRLLQVLPKEL